MSVLYLGAPSTQTSTWVKQGALKASLITPDPEGQASGQEREPGVLGRSRGRVPGRAGEEFV